MCNYFIWVYWYITLWIDKKANIIGFYKKRWSICQLGGGLKPPKTSPGPYPCLGYLFLLASDGNITGLELLRLCKCRCTFFKAYGRQVEIHRFVSCRDEFPSYDNMSDDSRTDSNGRGHLRVFSTGDCALITVTW